MAQLTRHAKQQIAARSNNGIITEWEVVNAVQCVESQVVGRSVWDVKVVVKVLRQKVVCEDGSNGDVVLACVDPDTLNIKTVMFQRKSQVKRRIKDGEAYVSQIRL